MPFTPQVELQAVSRAAIECMGPDWYKIFSGMEVACAINSLRPGCSYRVRVRSANQVGQGSLHTLDIEYAGMVVRS